jgi:hypothetical protein
MMVYKLPRFGHEIADYRKELTMSVSRPKPDESVAYDSEVDEDTKANDALVERVEKLAEKGNAPSDREKAKLTAELAARPIRQHLSNRATDWLDENEV